MACDSNPNDANNQWDENSIKASLIRLINERESVEVLRICVLLLGFFQQLNIDQI